MYTPFVHYVHLEPKNQIFNSDEVVQLCAFSSSFSTFFCKSETHEEEAWHENAAVAAPCSLLVE